MDMSTYELERPPAAGRRFGARLNVRQVKAGEALAFGGDRAPHWRVELAPRKGAGDYALVARDTGAQSAVAAVVDLAPAARGARPEMQELAIYACTVYSPMLAVAMRCRAHYIQWYAVAPDRTVRGLIRATQRLGSSQHLGPVIDLDQVHAASADAIRAAIGELNEAQEI